jgi:hypothetical protein
MPYAILTWALFAQWTQVALGNSLGFIVPIGHDELPWAFTPRPLFLPKAALNGGNSKFFLDKGNSIPGSPMMLLGDLVGRRTIFHVADAIMSVPTLTAELFRTGNP